MTLPFEVVATCSLTERDRSEDAWGCAGRFAWVIDGASPLRPGGTSDTVAYVARLEAALVDGASRATSVHELLDHAHRSTTDPIWQGCPGDELPSAAIGLLHHGDAGRVDVALLGDVTIVSTRPAVHWHDDRIEPLDEAVVERLAGLTRAGMSTIEARSAVSEQLRSNRRRLNTEGAYWVLAPDPQPDRDPVAQAIRHHVDVTPGSTFLLVTDGFARAVDVLDITGWQELAAMSDDASLAAIGQEIRYRERSDPELFRFPRLGKHDDATAVSIRVGGMT